MLSDVQRLLLQAVQRPEPAAWLRAQLDAAAGAVVTTDERAMLVAIDTDGLALTRRLVRKLRLQRLARGDARLARELEAEPAAFARRFVAYEAAVPPRAVFPAEEAAALRAFEGPAPT